MLKESKKPENTKEWPQDAGRGLVLTSDYTRKLTPAVM